MSLRRRSVTYAMALATAGCLAACAAPTPPAAALASPARAVERPRRAVPLRLASYVGIGLEETEAYRELRARRDCDDTWMHEPYFREVIDRERADLATPIDHVWLNDGQDSDWATAEVLARARQVRATVVLLARRRMRLHIEDVQGQLYCRVLGTGTLALLDVASGASLATEAITSERIQAAGGESHAYAEAAASLLRWLRGESAGGMEPGSPSAGDDAAHPAAIGTAVRSCPERVAAGDYAISDAASLRQLSGVTRIQGGLTIRGTRLADLRGLECLARVEGMLDVRENALLASLAGLEHLADVGGSVVVGHNPALASLAGLSGLTRATAVQLIGNETLASLAGLERLVACTVYVIIQDHPALTSLAGLEALRHPGDSLFFLNNAALSSCAIDELVQRLRRDQWSGEVRSEGNFEAGSCPR